ncbi:MAG: 50S ribosomal protein L25 [Brevinema sp.]
MADKKWSTEKLEAKSRPLSSKGSNDRLRAEFRLPAVVYGPEIKENVYCSIDYVAFEKLFAVNERHVPFTVSVEGKNFTVIIKEYKIDPISRRFLHVDFFAIKKDKEYQTLIPITFSGTPVGVREGGTLLTYARKLAIRALPADMPKSIPLDIAHLQKKQYVIVRDLPALKGCTIVTNKGVVIAEVK